MFSGYVNGRLAEAQVLAAYVDLSKRINWAVGLSQEPYYFLEPSEVRVNEPQPGLNTFVTNIRRLVVRSVFAQAYYPLSRFRRLEAGARFANVDDALLSINEPYIPQTGELAFDPNLTTDNLPGVSYVQPNVALVFDNSLTGYVGPFYGRRYRLEFAQTLGDWKFTQGTADYRRYDGIIGPIVLATRGFYFGRIRPDAQEFRIFGGSTDLIRGNTSGSYRRNECLNANDAQAESGLRGLRPPGGNSGRGGQRGAALPDSQSVVRPPGGNPADRGRALLRYRAGVGRAQHAQMEPRGRRRPHQGTHAASDHRRVHPGQPLRVCDRPAGLFNPAGPEGGQGTLDLQPRAHLLTGHPAPLCFFGWNSTSPDWVRAACSSGRRVGVSPS